MTTSTDMSFRAADVRVATGSCVWKTMNSIAGELNSVEVSGGERPVGSAHVADSDTPLIHAGKRGTLTVTVNSVFSDAASEAWRLVYNYYQTAPGTCYVMWAPEGSVSGSYAFDTGKGIITSCPPPGGEVATGDPLMFAFVVECAAIASSVLS